MNKDTSIIPARIKLEELFDSNTPIVLYVPSQYNEVPQIILEKPWSCVVTSSKSSEIAYSFSIDGKRDVKPYSDYEDILAGLTLSKKFLPIVSLSNYSNGSELQLGIRERQLHQDKLKKILRFTADMLQDDYGQMVILGYSPDQPGEIPIDLIYEAFHQSRKGALLLFDTENALNNPSSNEYIDDLVAHGQMLRFENDLADVFSSIDADKDDDNYIDYSELSVTEEPESVGIYINKKCISLPAKAILYTQGFVQILSHEEVPEVSIDSTNCEDYFYQFLKSSATRPVWYGYEYGFYLKRNYQEILVTTVKEDLRNSGGAIEKQSIMLIGQNSSSKSITLGALAYEIYLEKEYPVLFIRNPDINLDQNTSNYKALDELLQLLEEHGAKKTLIIWDNSSSTNQVTDTNKLNTVFVNRGRKVLLVTSAYEQPEQFYKNKKEEKNGIISVGNFKLVKSAIELSDKEPERLRELVTSHAGITAEQYERWFKDTDEKNLLTLLYKLLYDHIHLEIASGFQKEVLWGTNHLIKQLDDAYKNNNPYLGPMAAAFVKAGFDLSEIIGEVTEEKEQNGDKLVLLCNIVATSYQRKVRLPLSLLLRVINLELDDRFSCFQQAMFDVPFLSIDLPENDNSGYDYVVSFRTQLESELYLINQGISPEDQINNICKLIISVSVAGAYDRNSELSVIERLIKVIGPNTEINRDKNHKFSPYYSKVIDAMAQLRQQVLEPRLACQEVVWMREVYGKDSNKFDVGTRILKLREAQQLARKTMDILADEVGQYATNSYKITRNSLVVESALIEHRLHLIQKKEPDSTDNYTISFDYVDLSRSLQGVIASDPSNTYPYNALLNLFIDYYYDSSVDDERRVEYLSEILSVIDDADNNQREVLDNEEYQEHKSVILNFESSEKYQEYYEELLQRGSASGIHLKARRILREAGIEDFREPIETLTQQADARRVIDLIRDNGNVTSSHSGCQMILLNLTWLLHNGQPIFGKEQKERQLTNMNSVQWQEINNICKNFEQQFLRSGEKPFNGPMMYYLLALSSAQLENYSESFDAFRKIDESMMFTQVRNKVWHILCDANGVPKKFKGRVERQSYNEKNRSGYITIEGVSRNKKVHFYAYNLHLPDIFVAKTDFEIGTNYIGFTAFRELEKGKGGMGNG